MDIQLIKAQAIAQIERDFPVKRKQITLTPLHKDLTLLIGSASTPMRMRDIIAILVGDEPYAPGWTDRVLQLVEALHELKEAGILNVARDGWTKL